MLHVSRVEIPGKAASLAQAILGERGCNAAEYAATKTLQMLDEGSIEDAVLWTQVSLAIHQLDHTNSPTDIT